MVIPKGPFPRSYAIQTPNGIEYQRNHQHLSEAKFNSNRGNSEIVLNNIDQFIMSLLIISWYTKWTYTLI